MPSLSSVVKLSATAAFCSCPSYNHAGWHHAFRRNVTLRPRCGPGCSGHWLLLNSAEVSSRRREQQAPKMCGIPWHTTVAIRNPLDVTFGWISWGEPKPKNTMLLRVTIFKLLVQNASYYMVLCYNLLAPTCMSSRFKVPLINVDLEKPACLEGNPNSSAARPSEAGHKKCVARL